MKIEPVIIVFPEAVGTPASSRRVTAEPIFLYIFGMEEIEKIKEEETYIRKNKNTAPKYSRFCKQFVAKFQLKPMALPTLRAAYRPFFPVRFDTADT